MSLSVGLIALAKRLLAPLGVRSRADLVASRPIALGRESAQRARSAARMFVVALLAAAWHWRGHSVKPGRPFVCFVTHAERQCGIFEFGLAVARALESSEVFSFVYVECSRARDLLRALLRYRPVAIIYNHHPATMPWMSATVSAAVRRITGHAVRQIAIIHECPQSVVDAAVADTFDYHIAPDPTLVLRNPIVFTTGRLIPEYVNRMSPPDVVTVGSFGFGGDQKRYDLVVQSVQREFDRAVVRINIPFNGVADADGVLAKRAAERCRRVPSKPGVTVEITHHFFDRQQVLDFLASNTLNAFIYDWQDDRGLSAAVESALAVGRPVAVNRTPMFRHLWDASPSICVEETSLRDIIANGTGPLRPFVEKWRADPLRAEYEAIVARVIAGKYLYESVPAVPGIPRCFNRILDAQARRLYEPAIRKLFLLSPALMERKIPEANVQQAFVLDTVQALVGPRVGSARILCVGCYDDTAFTSLRRLGYHVTGIDPAINCDLRTFAARRRNLRGTFDIVFSTSVLEHVADDEEFVRQKAEFLVPGGHCVMTCDYSDAYQPGDPRPSVDERLYTERDLRQRLLPAMDGCVLVDTPVWGRPEPDFVYEGCRYTFATLTVQKQR